MDEQIKRAIIENYRKLYVKHGGGPEVGQWSEEGQRFRFEKLIEVGQLTNKSVLDLGCGLGDLYPFLLQRFGSVKYMGIDIVPELVDSAANRYQPASFACRDILSDGIDGSFDYVLISGMFNNAIPDCTSFLKKIITVAFQHCLEGLAFNFISSYVNFADPAIAYHNPLEVMKFCVENLSRKVTIQHHYERCDVAVFVYK